jgi:general secretion pathway protein A
MYTPYYGFREKPFNLSPDPRFLYLSGSHREVLGHLVYGIEQGEGFMAITGEVGTGKTTLCRTLLRRLGAESEVAFIFNPTLTPLELLKAINSEFGLSTFGDSRPELTDALNDFLLEQRHEGRRVLLIVDEAQNLSTETLEQLRLLSNLETETSKLLQIVLLGQPELDQKLSAKDLRQLRQRISVWWHLGPLDAAETREYVRHRLRVAGAQERPIFTDAALRTLHQLSKGVPRVINLLCDRALLAGYADQKAQIGRRLVLRAAVELRPARPRRRLARAWLGLAAAAALPTIWAIRVYSASRPSMLPGRADIFRVHVFFV